ncbi:hypothetical protein SAMN04487843_12673 [Methylobacterium sp. ap11]|uniref:hypothetical protein n=1 Tax=Methylobacterium sp. ap11 TaxID=1761799 RepID=UPI0008BFACFA|nr:hypothetical protein [Methylobacterium sp. ap11]SEP48180.1 hypothetical protein SAMN04487843_12673 [Methylobacterium sp. ap11]
MIRARVDRAKVAAARRQSLVSLSPVQMSLMRRALAAGRLALAAEDDAEVMALVQLYHIGYLAPIHREAFSRHMAWQITRRGRLAVARHQCSSAMPAIGHGAEA